MTWHPERRAAHHVRMTWTTRIMAAFGITRAKDAGAALAAVTAPVRLPPFGDPRSMTAVYRAVQVIVSAASQLPLTVERGGAIIPQASVPAFVRRPDPRMGRAEWVTHMVSAMVLHGNAYARIERDSAGNMIALRPLDPRAVMVTVNPTTHAIVIGAEGQTLSAADVLHAHLQPETTGAPFGLGPIQAARLDLQGARQTRDFAAQWFDGTGQPTGILSSDAASYEDAVRVRNAWNGIDDDGNPVDQSRNPSGVKVLPKNFTYAPLSISPREAQWLEAREFDTLQIARLFGIPSTLMLAAPSGGSMTYSNAEQDWISFVRFSLMYYLRPLEEALSDVTARGQDVRFNLEGLLRSDTKSRYDAYAVALASGFMTLDEVRALEGRDPLPTPNGDTNDD